MRRSLLTAALAVAAVAVVTGSAFGLVAAPQPTQLAIAADAVVVGKVTAVEKDLAEVPSPYPGTKDKQSWKIAVVKVETALSGIDAAKVKEIKVGVFQPKINPPANPANPPAKPAVAVRPPGGPGGPPVAFELKEGQEVLLFLTKHPHGDFYIMPGFNRPVDVTTDAGKKTLDEVKKVTAVLADPTKALKSDTAEARGEAAAIIVTKYRTAPAFTKETEQVAIGADESKLLLKALAEGEWKAARFGAPNAFNAFNMLGLTEKDGWIRPAIAPPPPGQPPVDFAAVTKDAFTKWLAGPGKDYQIKKVVPKK